MAHGAAIKAGYAPTRTAKVGDVVAFYQMERPCNAEPGPGPHRAVVTAIGEYSTRVSLRVGDAHYESVDHRSATETGRLWDWK